MALPKSYGIAAGWPVGAGQVASSGTPTLTLSTPVPFTTTTAAGPTVTTVSGLASGETVSSVNVPQLAVSGANIIVGLTAATAGTLAFTVTTSLGRTVSGSVAVTSGAALSSAYTDLATTTAPATVRNRSCFLMGYTAAAAATVAVQDGASANKPSNNTVTTITMAAGDDVTFATPMFFTNGLHVDYTAGPSITWKVM